MRIEGDPDPERPRMRGVEAFPVRHGDREMIALRDPAGWTDSVLLVTPETLFVISRLDGTNTLRDVQAACTRRFQQIMPLDPIKEVIEALDRALLLDSPRFRRHRESIEGPFLASKVRPAAHAGSGYPADPEEVRAELDACLDAAPVRRLPPGRIAALIAPHIDLRRGSRGYGAAYRTLRDRCRADLFVILGTAHASPEPPFVATRKGFETPLGSVETDGAFLDALERRYGSRLFDEESAHRGEHSIEFQALFLRRLFQERPVRIVPILCSSFHEQIAAGGLPSQDPAIGDFLGALRETLAERPEACVIAAADLAHIGPRFGDPAPVSDETASWNASRDGEALKAAAAGDGAAFFAVIAAERDARRICGVSAIYALLETLPQGAAGTLLHYGNALDEERTTFVSFASMVFTSAGGRS